MRGSEVYVMKPNKNQVKKIAELINSVEEGKKITDEDIANIEDLQN